jgi:hypothetical protein
MVGVLEAYHTDIKTAYLLQKLHKHKYSCGVSLHMCGAESLRLSAARALTLAVSIEVSYFAGTIESTFSTRNEAGRGDPPACCVLREMDERERERETNLASTQQEICLYIPYLRFHALLLT